MVSASSSNLEFLPWLSFMSPVRPANSFLPYVAWYLSLSLPGSDDFTVESRRIQKISRLLPQIDEPAFSPPYLAKLQLKSLPSRRR